MDEEINRDLEYRTSAIARAEEARSTLSNASTSVNMSATDTPLRLAIPIPHRPSAATIRAGHDVHSPSTPGFGIGLATPGGLASSLSTTGNMGAYPFPSEDETSDFSSSFQLPEHTRISLSEKPNDYFSSKPVASVDTEKSTAASGGEQPATPLSQTPIEPDKEEKKRTGSLFGKKFRMDFSTKKLGRSSTDASKPPVVAQQEEKVVEESEKSSTKEEKVFEQNLRGLIDRIHHEYDEFLVANPGNGLISALTPSRQNETPFLAISPRTTIYIQEESADTALAYDLYGGSIDDLRGDIDKLEKSIPLWLAELLLKVVYFFPFIITSLEFWLRCTDFFFFDQDQIPRKEPAKLAFTLRPYDDLLPQVVKTDGYIAYWKLLLWDTI